MNEYNVSLIMTKFQKHIPKESVSDTKKRLSKCSEETAETLLKMPKKNWYLTIVFAVLFGGIALDRFYLGDKGFGAIKLSVHLIAVLLVRLKIEVLLGFTLIFFITTAIWGLTDIVASSKAAKQINMSNLDAIIN